MGYITLAVPMAPVMSLDLVVVLSDCTYLSLTWPNIQSYSVGWVPWMHFMNTQKIRIAPSEMQSRSQATYWQSCWDIESSTKNASLLLCLQRIFIGFVFILTPNWRGRSWSQPQRMINCQVDVTCQYNIFHGFIQEIRLTRLHDSFASRLHCIRYLVLSF